MKRAWMRCLVLILPAAIAGCPAPDEPGTGDQTNDFAEFVLDLIANTSDTGAPVSVSHRDFEFAQSGRAFDDLFRGAMSGK